VDSNDLPLNISRETLQQNKVLRIIKKNLVKKSLEMFGDIAEKGEEEYAKFWKNFGKNIKWGVCEDSDNKDKLLELLRVNTSKSKNDLVSLKDYVGRMGENQKDIYYITGENLLAVENSPFLEKLKQKGYEVVFLTEPIDEYMVQAITEYDGKAFKNVTKEGLELGEDEEHKKKMEELKKDNEGLCKYVKDILGDRVARVVVSDRITETPCVLVTDQHGLSANMERILRNQPLRKNEMFGPMRSTKVLEINIEHPIVQHIKKGMDQKDNEKEQKYVKDIVNLVYETSLLHSGFSLENPASFSKTIFNVIKMNIELDVEDDESDDENVNINEKLTEKFSGLTVEEPVMETVD
jgi:molecular chaperone HtpG